MAEGEGLKTQWPKSCNFDSKAEDFSATTQANEIAQKLHFENNQARAYNTDKEIYGHSQTLGINTHLE